MDVQEVRWEHYPLIAAHPAARSFVERLALKGKRPKTVDAYARAVEDLLMYFAATDPSRLLEADETDLDAYLCTLKQRGPKKRGRGGMIEDETKIRSLTGRKLSDNTIAQRIVACRLFYDFLDCVKCGMFIGGEKARLLHAGENTLPIESKVPMTPVAKCEVAGDEAGADTCRAALQDMPAPEAPDPTLIFNPEGLSNQELENLARLATAPALDKLRQALDAHEKRLGSIQQHKSGRSALINAQKKRISLIQQLIVDSEWHMAKQQGHAQKMT